MIDDLLNQMNEQYEEEDSKEQAKEQEVDMEAIWKVNDQTLKWLEEEREYIKNSKDDSLSRGAFEKRRDSAYQKNSRAKDDDKKEESSYSRYQSSYYSSSKDSKKDSDQDFFDKLEKKFNQKVERMIDATLNQELNVANGECNWDILDWQYELNKKRVHDRYYVEERATKPVIKKIQKYADRCDSKINMAESLLYLKQNLRGDK